MVTLSLSESNLSASSMLATYASFATSVMLARSMAHELLPPPLLSYLFSAARSLLRRSTPITVVVRESSGISRNQVYEDAELYLSTKIGPSTGRVGVSKTARQRKIQVAVEKDQEIVDHYQDVRITWRLVCPAESDNYSREKNFFELTFDSRSRQIVMESYIPFVMERAAAIRDEDKVVRLYNRDCPNDNHDSRRWGSVILEHPSNFNTLAIDPDLKRWIIDDLDRFVQRRDFYKRVGKAWKRGYLLYGPPGTGKSSLIAAMANYLKFDVYDLDLSSIYDNSSLRQVLLSTTNKSILVIEDIDCNKKVQDRAYSYSDDGGDDGGDEKMTLSGLLNFIDGLWSSCGDERILVFTTNHKDRLDPALLRPGRMDVHINMSYCTFQSFEILASNYLGISVSDHPLCPEIEATMEAARVSPAEVAEELMKTDDADEVLNGLVGFLKRKKAEIEINGNGNGSGSGGGGDDERWEGDENGNGSESGSGSGGGGDDESWEGDENGNGSESGSGGGGDDESWEGDENEVPAKKKRKLRSGRKGRRVRKGYYSDDEQ